jgi:plastocyanin
MNTSGISYPAPALSSRKQWTVIIVVILVVVAAIITGVLLTNREAVSQISASALPSAHVSIASDGLDVTDVKVKKGQGVVWQNQGTGEHQLALSSGVELAPDFGGGMRITTGQNYTYVFDKPGTYHYYDVMRPTQVKGTVTVAE